MTRRLLNCQRLLGMVVTMLCLLGIAAYSTMPRQEDPSFPYRAGMITVSYPGASAEAVERLVLQPLTDELRQVEELDWSQGTARTGVALGPAETPGPHLRHRFGVGSGSSGHGAGAPGFPR